MTLLAWTLDRDPVRHAVGQGERAVVDQGLEGPDDGHGEIGRSHPARVSTAAG